MSMNSLEYFLIHVYTATFFNIILLLYNLLHDAQPLVRRWPFLLLAVHIHALAAKVGLQVMSFWCDWSGLRLQLGARSTAAVVLWLDVFVHSFHDVRMYFMFVLFYVFGHGGVPVFEELISCSFRSFVQFKLFKQGWARWLLFAPEVVRRGKLSLSLSSVFQHLLHSWGSASASTVFFS